MAERCAGPLSRSREEAAAFSEFYRQHIQNVVIFFTRSTLQPDTSMDLAAETFARAFAARGRFRGETPEQERAWLYAIARRQLSDYFRRGRAEQKAVARLGIQVPRLSDEDHARIEELAGLPKLRALVAGALEGLSLDQRTALRLRVVEELGYPDIARRLEISEQAARARVSRGLRALAASLNRHPMVERGEA